MASTKFKFEVINIHPEQGVLVIDGVRTVTKDITEDIARRMHKKGSRYIQEVKTKQKESSKA